MSRYSDDLRNDAQGWVEEQGRGQGIEIREDSDGYAVTLNGTVKSYAASYRLATALADELAEEEAQWEAYASESQAAEKACPGYGIYF